MKGIILAGGKATRLTPVTGVVSKQLLPIYNKPMIYYPLSTMISAGISDILIISNPTTIPLLKNLLGNGSNLGINLDFVEQSQPNGIAEAFILGEEFIGKDHVSLILGDNLFFGTSLKETLLNAAKETTGATIFSYRVDDPSAYGVVEFNQNNEVLSIEEKPTLPRSNFAVTGLYFYDNNVIDYAKSIKPSARNELEITDVNKIYLAEKKLSTVRLRTGTAWLDTGTFDSLIEASSFVRTIEKRQGTLIGSPEAESFKNGWISQAKFTNLLEGYSDNNYKEYLRRLIEETHGSN